MSLRLPLSLAVASIGMLGFDWQEDGCCPELSKCTAFPCVVDPRKPAPQFREGSCSSSFCTVTGPDNLRSCPRGPALGPSEASHMGEGPDTRCNAPLRGSEWRAYLHPATKSGGTIPRASPGLARSLRRVRSDVLTSLRCARFVVEERLPERVSQQGSSHEACPVCLWQ
jgi:hypothetical protein